MPKRKNNKCIGTKYSRLKSRRQIEIRKQLQQQLIQSKHFEDTFMGKRRLKEDAVPTLYLDVKEGLRKEDRIFPSTPEIAEKENCKESPQIDKSLPSRASITEIEPKIMEPVITIKEEPTVLNEPIMDNFKEEQEEFMSEFETIVPDPVSIQNEAVMEPLLIFKEEPADENCSLPSINTTAPSEEKKSHQTDNSALTTKISEDEHKLFLNSLLPLFSELNAIQTIRVRSKIQEILLQEIISNTS